MFGSLCLTLQMPKIAPIWQEIETESELEEERVPTPEVMKKEDEDLDTDQVKTHVQCPISNPKDKSKKKERGSWHLPGEASCPIHHSLDTNQTYCLGEN